MLAVKLICVGKLKEKFYIDAVREYAKRLGGYCSLEIDELPEAKLSAVPGEAEINQALDKERAAIEAKIPKGAAVIAMCIEGEQPDSEDLAAMLADYAVRGVSRLCFIIGGSFGIHPEIKRGADRRLSMSKMTFPHNLARVILLEQIYRGFKIAEGGKYHK